MKKASGNNTAVIAVALVVLAVAALSFYSAHSAKGRLVTLRAQHSEMLSMKDELSALRGRVAAVEGRSGFGRVSGIEQAVDRVLTPMGLKGKLESLKNIASDDGADRARLSLRDMDMNETVNVLYNFEHAPVPVVIKQAELRESFQRPGRLDMNITLSLVKR